MSRPAGPHAKEIHAEQWREIKTTLRWPVCAANINVSSKGVTPNHPNLNIYFGIEPIGNRHFRYCWRWQVCCFVSIRTHSTDEADTSTFEKNCRTDCPDGHANSQFTSLSIIFGNAFEKTELYVCDPSSKSGMNVVWIWIKISWHRSIWDTLWTYRRPSLYARVVQQDFPSNGESVVVKCSIQ